MKNDLYTKTILTVIAICLTINVIKDLEIIPKAHASKNTVETSSDYKLVPISDNNTLDVRIVDIDTYDELDVNINSIDTYDELKVNINSIDSDDELNVNIDEVGGQYVTHGGPLPVKTN
ncbi:hypothetical protein [Marixanthomonas spongiae]|uniref:Uncharacterized protein n=1 Tax=Marixanthomonas spongiae TaxID=2174845 RepID=A0A2U0HYR0_9FLAO|nr:hypothetical protein [Marixanthomonas spongiae]PVW13977.1 hypothetical protein DDV96_12460 [Marixanthomonas spongiae]